MACPYCGSVQAIEKPPLIRFLWAHPVEGPPSKKWDRLDRHLTKRINAPSVPFGTVEKSFPCASCRAEFHVMGTRNKPEDGLIGYFRAEFNRIPPATIIDKALGGLKIPYPAGCFLIAIAIFLLWTVPISLVEGIPKITRDASGPLLIMLVMVLLTSIKYVGDRVRHFRDDFLRLAKVRECFSEWTYYRYSYHILGRPDPPLVSTPTLAGMVTAAAYVLLGLVMFVVYPQPLTGLEGAASADVFFQTYTSIPARVATTLVWAVISFIAGVAIWIGVGTAWDVRRIGLSLPLNYDPLDKLAGVKSLADLAVASLLPLASIEILLLPYALLGLGQGMPLRNPAAASSSFAAVTLVGALVLTLFIAALSSVHDGVRHWKEWYLFSLYRKARKTLEKPWCATQRERTAALSLFPYYESVSSIREWPYDLGTILKVVSVAACSVVATAMEHYVLLILPH